MATTLFYSYLHDARVILRQAAFNAHRSKAAGKAYARLNHSIFMIGNIIDKSVTSQRYDTQLLDEVKQTLNHNNMMILDQQWRLAKARQYITRAQRAAPPEIASGKNRVASWPAGHPKNRPGQLCSSSSSSIV